MRKVKKKTAKKRLMILIPAILAALAVVIFGVYFGAWRLNRYQAEVSLVGEQEMIVEVGSGFTDPGASAWASGSLFDKEKMPLDVVTSGSVDTQTLGSYELRYSARYSREHFLGDKKAEAEAVRTVKVVDTQLPVISLTANEGTFTFPGQAYEEEGYTAVDNYDGDMTAAVVREEKDGKVYYTVTDSSGNTAQVVRDIFYDDPVAPELTLSGEDIVQVKLGDTFVDPGYQATDNIDGDITAKVTVEGTVDTATVGRYTLTYTATDGFGNSVSCSRLVKVVEKIMPPLPEGKGGVIYLTFDDGPGEHTARLLDILDKYNVKATFFVVGRYDLSLTKEMVARGHSVGNHSLTHNYSKLYASKESFFNELYGAQDRIEAACGIRTRLVRFPGGSSNSVSTVSMSELTRALVNAGYAYFDWNVDSKDAGGATTCEEVVYNVCSGIATKKTAVVLQHDIKDYSVDAVEEIIIWGLENGYTFKALTVSSPGCHHGTRN